MARVTIKQVAEKAGLSIATVSRVMNNHPDVSAETRQRVQQIVDDLGYAPNAVARSLIQGRSHILGVVSTGIEFYGPSQTMAGIERQATQAGYWVMSGLLHDPEHDRGEDALNHVLSQQVDGIIWAVPEVGKNREWICDHKTALPVPIVFLHMDCRDDLFMVSVDNYTGARMAVEHLLAQGYRRIGCVAGPPIWWEAQQRQRGWRDALADADRDHDDSWIVFGDWTAASGMTALPQLLAQHPDIDAVFAINDQMALGVLKAAYQARQQVPHDLGVIGFDDIPEAAYFLPALTTVRHDLKGVGTLAVSMLDRVLAAHAEGKLIEPEAIWITPELVVRESTVR